MHVGSTNVKLLHLPFVDVLLLRTILASIHPFMVDTPKQMFVVLKASRGCHHHSLTFTLSLSCPFFSLSLALSDTYCSFCKSHSFISSSSLFSFFIVTHKSYHGNRNTHTYIHNPYTQHVILHSQSALHAQPDAHSQAPFL